jgi:sterol desaturase/sphingolipid hydroxylase (fatty acid hydroxylase superfamily)/CDGSH-type Zn-finger protein
MNSIINFIANKNILIVAGVLLAFGVSEAIFGFFQNSKRTKSDLFIEVINTFFLFVITKPLIMLVAFAVLKLVIPNQENVLGQLPFWLSLAIFILIDDCSQYWYHRLAHENKWLWKWHRPHHSATEMGLLVSYRQAVYYYMLMPNIWFIGIYTFLGGGIPVAVGLVAKQIVVISSHSLISWDKIFYRYKFLNPFITVIERILITPAFHHAHHAVSIIDDIGNPNGNFGNMFSFWDQLFGTAKFVHAFPTAYGLPNDPNDGWASHSFYPLIISDKPNSEISKNYIFKKTTESEPPIMVLEKGDYLYCQCGFSKHQPFCDGSHHGTKFKPLKFTLKSEREYKLCQCKLCKNGPFCDNSHLKINASAE